MRLITFNEFETKVRTDLDLLDTDNFVGQDEFAGLTNEAIDTAQALIMRTREDYLLTSAPLSLVNGASSIELPTTIYAQKIRSIIYNNAGRIYPLKRVHDPEMFYRKAVIDSAAVALDEYEYLLKSTTAGENDKIILTPPSYETGAFLELWYIRHANRIPLQAAPDSATRAAQLATVIDIPEWRAYLEIYVKNEIYVHKLKDLEMASKSGAKLSIVADAMVVALKDRVEDNDTGIYQDISHYVESN